MNGTVEGLESLAALVSTGQPGTEQLARDVLGLLADTLNADAICLCGIDGALRVDRLYDRRSSGLREGDCFNLHDQHSHARQQNPSFHAGLPDDGARFESLLLASRTGMRSCTGIPLYRLDGRLYGRLCALSSYSRSAVPGELTLLRLAGHILMEVVETTERRREAEAWKHQALHDSLTGLPNRDLLRDRMEHAVVMARRERVPLAVLLIDLDKFKSVNDSLGHRAGDALLAQIGPRIRRLLRETDTVARLSGDEFVVLLPEVDEKGALLVTSKVLHALRQPFDVETQRTGISASIGIALFPDHGQDATLLLQRADEAMYVAKRCEAGVAIFTRGETLPAPEPLHTPHARQS